MARKRKKQKKPDPTSWSPILKPGDILMPLCTTCKTRPVSDARKSECGRCSISTHLAYENFYLNRGRY